MTRANIKRTAAAITAAVAIIVSTYKWITPTGNNGLYGKVGSWIKTPEGRLNQAKWLMKNGFNDYAAYGMSDYLYSNPAAVADFILQYRRLGGKDVSLIYGKASTVTIDLDYYHRTIKNDSSRFSSVAMEYEQYQKDMSRPVFYTMLPLVWKYCKINKLYSWIYQGWPDQPDCDSIAKYADGVWLHSYIKMDKYSNVGDALYGYQKTRLGMFAISGSKIKKQLRMRLLTSNENPDSLNAKTGKVNEQFGWKYYTKNSVTSAINSFQNKWNLSATPLMKQWLKPDGGQLFYEPFQKRITT
jgi:hypothetical protein